MSPAVVRAVIDTSVLIRGILRRQTSAPVAVFDAMLAEDFVSITSDYILDEVRRTLEEPGVRVLRALTGGQIVAIVSLLEQMSEIVPGRLQALNKVPTDMKDNAIVAAALEGNADFLVSSDRRDLLPLKVIKVAGFKPIQVVSPTLFLRELVRG